MMLKTNVLKWADALESGEFKQAFHALQREEGFCCLGVACEVYNRTAPKNNRVKIGKGKTPDGIKYVTYGTKADYPPKRVVAHYGLGKSLMEELANMNDLHKRNFKYIGKFIRTQFYKGE